MDGRPLGPQGSGDRTRPTGRLVRPPSWGDNCAITRRNLHDRTGPQLAEIPSFAKCLRPRGGTARFRANTFLSCVARGGPMRGSIAKRSGIVVSALAVAAFVSMGVADAVTTNNNVIHGCYAKSDGK